MTNAAATEEVGAGGFRGEDAEAKSEMGNGKWEMGNRKRGNAGRD